MKHYTTSTCVWCWWRTISREWLTLTFKRLVCSKWKLRTRWDEINISRENYQFMLLLATTASGYDSVEDQKNYLVWLHIGSYKATPTQNSARFYRKFCRQIAVRLMDKIFVAKNGIVFAFLGEFRHFLRQLHQRISLWQSVDEIVCLILTRVQWSRHVIGRLIDCLLFGFELGNEKSRGTQAKERQNAGSGRDSWVSALNCLIPGKKRWEISCTSTASTAATRSVDRRVFCDFKKWSFYSFILHSR